MRRLPGVQMRPGPGRETEGAREYRQDRLRKTCREAPDVFAERVAGYPLKND